MHGQNHIKWQDNVFGRRCCTKITGLEKFFFQNYCNIFFYTMSKVLVREEALGLNRWCDNVLPARSLRTVTDRRNQWCNVISKGKPTILGGKHIPVSVRQPWISYDWGNKPETARWKDSSLCDGWNSLFHSWKKTWIFGLIFIRWSQIWTHKFCITSHSHQITRCHIPQDGIPHIYHHKNPGHVQKQFCFLLLFWGGGGGGEIANLLWRVYDNTVQFHVSYGTLFWSVCVCV